MLFITSRLTTTPSDLHSSYGSISTTLTCLLHNANIFVHITVSSIVVSTAQAPLQTFWSPVKLGRSLGTKPINSIGPSLVPRCECAVPGNKTILALMTKLTLNM